MRETTRDKGRRLLVEGRLIVLQVDKATGYVHARCRGDSGALYELGYDPSRRQWRCTCPELRGRCSHLVALQLVVVKRQDPR